MFSNCCWSNVKIFALVISNEKYQYQPKSVYQSSFSLIVAALSVYFDGSGLQILACTNDYFITHSMESWTSMHHHCGAS